MKKIISLVLLVMAIISPCMADSPVFIEKMVQDPNVTVTYISQAMLGKKNYKDMMARLPISSEDARFEAVHIFNCQSQASSNAARNYVADYVKEKTAESEKINAEHGKIVQNKPQLLMKSASGDTSTLIYGFYRTKDSYWFNQIIILMTENKKTTLIDIKGLFPIRSLIIGN
ncbi:DUF4252 domain-containing protein [Paramuribaculum intestinale]|uniref:DUF4252 domain-containing protein n=1 Tax=Paramuribaculum intestinale TaxID=2094151 RepID=UPI0025B1FC02|nr:DUF4252 domain-containing protein [Paramuribaculum intestinale]